MAVALGRDLADAAQPLAERGQGVPGLLRACQHRRLLGRLGLQGGLAPLGGREGLFDGGVPLAYGGLVDGLLLEPSAERHQVVGKKAYAGVAQVGLDDGGPAGDLGLASEGLELSAQLGGEVLDAREVGLHRVQLAQGLLLALAVLENARGLLDDRAAAFGTGVQDAVELALADDHVHLAADAGVGQQLLDVEQAAGVAVDGVLALPRPEHQAADRHLGVVDGQRAVGVVDREEDLGAAERRARRVPAKMTSSILPPRSDLAPCSPITHASASTTLDLPEPLGPTTQVMPGSKRSVVEDAKDLKPRNVRLFKYKRLPILSRPPVPRVPSVGGDRTGSGLLGLCGTIPADTRRPASDIPKCATIDPDAWCLW